MKDALVCDALVDDDDDHCCALGYWC